MNRVLSLQELTALALPHALLWSTRLSTGGSWNLELPFVTWLC
jgi:hypothetical protein